MVTTSLNFLLEAFRDEGSFLMDFIKAIWSLLKDIRQPKAIAFGLIVLTFSVFAWFGHQFMPYVVGATWFLAIPGIIGFGIGYGNLGWKKAFAWWALLIVGFAYATVNEAPLNILGTMLITMGLGALGFVIPALRGKELGISVLWALNLGGWPLAAAIYTGLGYLAIEGSLVAGWAVQLAAWIGLFAFLIVILLRSVRGNKATN